MDTIKTEQVFADRYEILEKLGVGGMAEVYRAFDRELNRHVAVKVLHGRFGNDSQFIERFRREARAAAGLNHPNVVQVYDWGKEGDIYFLVMELLEGQSIKEAITERGPLPPSEAISIALQVCSALDYAHEHKVIHRDIKPHNIMMSRAGHVKVTDFGIAYAQNDGGATVTQEGFLIGTAQYCSPEQAQGRPVVNSSDLYSLGIVLYEMLTTKVPFEGDNPISVALQQVRDEPRPPKTIRADIPDELQAVIMRSLRKNPEERYQNANEMAAALERSRMSARTMVSPAVPIPTFDEQPTMIAPAAPRAEPTLPQLENLPPLKEEKNGSKAWLIIIAALFLVGAAIAAFMLTRDTAPPTPAQVEVPDLQGLNLEQALRILKLEGLKAGKIHHEPNDSTDEGILFNQDPGAKERIDIGERVELYVSTGPADGEVPDVVGELLEDAKTMLEDAGFTVGETTRRYDDTVEKDEVISQDPPASSKEPKQSKISLVVSDGPKPVDKISVPDLSGLTASQALDKLTDLGLQGEQREEFSDSVNDGEVVRQLPSAGASIEKNSTVTIWVSKGSNQVQVPDLTGSPKNAAIRELRELGLKARFKAEDNEVFAPGTVIGTDPMAGEMANRGDTILLLIARKPPGASTTTTTSTTTTVPSQ